MAVTVAVPGRSKALKAHVAELTSALDALRSWVEEREYAGYEPYDILNSPRLAGMWKCSRSLSSVLIQAGRRFGGVWLRKTLGVPASRNPKALGLFLSGYCDLARIGAETDEQISFLRRQLQQLRAPDESEYAWGYDWNFASFRGGVLPAFSGNSIATYFCAEALLDLADLRNDSAAEDMARSACCFVMKRLNHSFESEQELCFSYTPQDRTLIFNNSVLVGALLARVGARDGRADYLECAKKSMLYLTTRQRADGAWTYGASPLQKWVDGFHTGYNLCALAEYRRHSGDHTFDGSMLRGYEFYKKRCFTLDGRPEYFEDRLYPIDIHACSQAVLTFCEFADVDASALERAVQVACWTIKHMRAQDGAFFYQRHRMWTNRTPYMRWGQAWMFRALSRLLEVVS